MERCEVLIIGAGPVGLTLAIDLGRRGARCTVVDRKAGPEFLPKMERCNARTMEIFRRMGLAEKIRAGGLPAQVPMDVFIVTEMAEPPLVHLPYPSVDAARREIAACRDTSMPAEPYQLVSQYTLEPILAEAAAALPSVTLLWEHAFEALTQDRQGVTARVAARGGRREIRADYLVGCDGGGSGVRQALGIGLLGEGDILRLRQALYRCDDLFDRLPIGDGPGQGRHYHVADDANSFLIMQDSTRHWTLHAVVEDDAAMARQFEAVVGVPVEYEMLYVGGWKQNLLLAERYRDGRVFLAGDAVHLVIPTGGLGMNTGIGDAVDLGWKLAAVLCGWGGPRLLDSYEAERRPVGDRNIGASRYASSGRRRWRGAWRRLERDAFIALAAEEQRKTNEMIGSELGYRYVGSPVIREEPGGPEMSFRHYDPTAWTGVRLPHAWTADGVAMQDRIGDGWTLLRLAGPEDAGQALVAALRALGAPATELALPDHRLRELYARDLFLLRPDLHVAWRGNAPPDDPDALARLVCGRP